MKKYILSIVATIALLIASLGNIAAQSSITGIVKEGIEGYPLVGVTVTILETSTSTTTGSLGEYTLGAATGQTRTIVVSGYPSSARTIVVAGGTNIINFWVNAVTDYDGNSYGASEIGTQVWMAENLRTITYNDGTNIPNVTDDTEWVGLSTPAYCWSNNDIGNKNVYGALYNWFVVNTGKLCPIGWSVPTDEQWHTLVLYLDPAAQNILGEESSIAGGKLKETGIIHWASPNIGATNEYGFTALPGGNRNPIIGIFSGFGISGNWWTSSEQYDLYAWRRGIENESGLVGRDFNRHRFGYSVRCIKDAVPPIVTTAGISNITSNTAQSGGYLYPVQGNDYTEGRGICWSTLSSPTVYNSSHTEDGSGTGSYTSLLTGLTPNTTYHVRAYGMNLDAPTFVYGNEVIFTTLSCPIIEITSAATASVCDNVALDYTATSSTAGATFEWTRAEVTGIANTVGAGATALINETLDNITAAPVNVTYVITPSYGGCAGTPFNLVVTVNPLPTPLITSTDADNIFCVGTSVTFTAGGGTNYNFRVEGTSVQNGVSTTYTTNALTNGQIVDVVVTNSVGCTATSTGITNTANSLPTATATNNGPICSSSLLSLTGGPNEMITYEWTGPNDFSSALQSPIVSSSALAEMEGGYTLTVTNNNGCKSSETTSVTINQLPTATISDPITVCKGATNPSITFTGIGGTPPYTFSYSLNDSAPLYVITTGENSSVGIDVPLETADLFDYRLWSVTDANGCSRTGMNLGTTVAVASATASTGEATLVTTGSAGLNGTVDANSFDADITFEYGLTTEYGNTITGTPSIVSGTDVTPVSVNVTGLVANTLYHFRVVASIQECLSYGEDLTFTTHCPTITPTISVINVSCYGQATGSIDLSVEGGQAPYTYLWSNGETIEDISLLSAGTYSVIVTDANRCIANASTDVTQPDDIIVNEAITNVNCNSCKDGSINITVTGGTGGYTFAWTGPVGFMSGVEDLTELKPGLYNLTITDANNCISESTYEVLSPFNVTNTNDDGMGSLRYAIQYANDHQTVTSDTITFSIPGTGPFSIQPQTSLPVLSGPIFIDGFSQPGTDAAVAKLLIEIAGVNIGAGNYGLQLAGGNSTIRGLVINRFRSAVRITSDGNRVYGNFIGTDITGSTGFELYTGTNTGISIYQGSDNIIGGESTIERNIISALTDGISLNTANHSMIIGNYIGLDVTGKNPLGNASSGIRLIGSSENLIGGNSPGTRNIIVSDDGYGIYLDNSERNIFKGNFIGVDASGTMPMGNNGTGMFVSGGSSDNIIGGAITGEGNVISGNQIGIWIYGDAANEVPNSNDNKVLGNLIGTDCTGAVSIGNSDCGVLIVMGCSGNQIGGMEKGEGNIIANSPKYGIWVFGENGVNPLNNLISCNSIYNNGRLGIELSTIRNYDGVTPNDPGDSDQGPNNFQNFPVLESLRFNPGTVTINGSLNSAAGTDYMIQFFVNKIGDESGYGEGQKYIGSAKVTTDASGDATFTETFPVYSSWGDTFTATATDPQGNTSEFSHILGGLKEQVVADADWPLHYSINKDGLPQIPETSTLDIDAINAAFNTWTDITTSTVEFICDGTTELKYAGYDSVNLVSFTDDQWDFGTGVLAVAAKTTVFDQNDVQSRITDSDIIFNPYWVNNLEYSFGVGNDTLYGGYFDIQSVATHEIGHIFGLIHSGIPGSSMFYMLGTGIYVRTLATDDIAWASYRYPESNYNSTFGSISGKITYGYSPVGDPQPVAGALIKAVNTDPLVKYSVHSYSDADGTYQVPGLIPGTYEVFIEPLDGDVQGFSLKPQNISSDLFYQTVYIDYPGEFYNENDAAAEEDNTKSSIAVTAGITTPGIDLTTNKDLTSPSVVSVSPDATITDFDIVKDITISFSEAIDVSTLTNETIYLEYTEGTETKKHFGTITPIGNGTNIILFNPESVLRYSTDYTFYVTAGVKDLKENSLNPSFTSTFTTMDADIAAPEITYVIPADGTDSVFVTEVIRLSFSEPMDKTSVESAFALTWNEEGTPAVSHEVEGSWQWDGKSMVMTFTPLRSLSEATEYTVTVSETAEDLGGYNLAAAQSFKFKTVPSSPPQIIYLGPADASTGVTVETPVVVDFSEPVNPETVSSETFKLTPTGGTQVSGTFDFLNDNSRVVFRPDVNLSFNSNYTIEITTGIEDLSQPALGMEVESTTIFTTASQITTPHIQYLEPSAGITGSVVLISGFGFDPDPANNTVTFNGIQTYVKNATLTELTTTVPNGVMSGPVTVKVNGVVSDNTMHFDIIPETLDPCSDLVANTSTETQKTHDVDIRGDCAYAYVTNPDDNTVSVVDLDPDNPDVVAVVNVGKTPVKIDIDPQGTKAYVTNYNSHDVSVIDISDEDGSLAEVVNTIKVGIEPYGIAVTPDGKRVYVANHYSENLSIIDVDPTSGGFDHVVANVSTGSGTTSVEVSGECALAVVTGDFGVKIVNADPEDPDYNSIIATVSSGTKTREVDISGEAGLAIVSTEEGNLLVINLYPEGGDYSDAVVANVPTGTKVSDVEISGDCMFVYVTDTQKGNVLVYKFTQTGTGIPDGSFIAGLTLEPHDTIEVGYAPMGLAIDDKAERLFITDGDPVGRRVTEIRICCGPITPSTELSELIMIIQNLITYGGVKESQGNTLIKKCNDALANIYIGKPKSAVNNLNDFINTVKEYIAGGKISRDQGNELITRAKAIIAMLKITKSAETGLLANDFDKSAIEEVQVSESGLGVIYPNPFSESVVISYEIAADDPGAVMVLIRIFDMSGRLIKTLVDLNMQPGSYTVLWYGKSNNGEQVPDGTYLVQFSAGTAEEVKEIIFIK